MALFVEDFILMAEEGCDCKDCENHGQPMDEIFLTPECHDAPSYVYFSKEDGILHILCAECDDHIACIAVALASGDQRAALN